MDTWFYYFWAFTLLAVCVLAWLTNLIGLPGNWIIVGSAALFAWLSPTDADRGLSWTAVAVLGGLAVLGEIAEFVAGAVGAAKQGAGKRSVALAMIGAFAGSIVGLAIGTPIPFLGSFVMALLGGAAGAFFGGYLGEAWKGRPHDTRIAVGRGAFTGRIWGTVAKLAVGATMLVITTWDALFN